MAYNNSFPVTYQPYYGPYVPTQQVPVQQPQTAPTPQPQVVNNNITWVQGEAGAKSYLVAPNTTVQLWDSEAQTIYLKSADGSGMPSMKVLDYTIRDTVAQNPTPAISEVSNSDLYVTKDELHTFEEKIEKRLDKLTSKSRRVVEDDE